MDDFEKRVFGCKSSLWAYEQEYRLILDRSGIFGFPRTALQQVILGCRAYPELKAYANQYADPTVNQFGFYQMCEDLHAYRLKKLPISRDTTLMSSLF